MDGEIDDRQSADHAGGVLGQYVNMIKSYDK